MAKGDIDKLNAKRTREERSKSASKAGKASGEARRFDGCAKKALMEMAKDESLEKAMDQLLKRAGQGNLNAIKMLLDYTENKADVTTNNNITVVIDKKDYDEWSN